MAPQDHPQQFTCTGLSSFNSNNSFVDMKCYGITSPLRNAYVDLVEHNEAREKPSADSSLHNLSCWGSAVYQHEVDAKTVSDTVVVWLHAFSAAASPWFAWLLRQPAQIYYC